MNFENKQFIMGRFCERIYIMRDDYQNNVKEWVDFMNDILREFGIGLNDKILLASIKLNYNFDEEIDIYKINKKKYYLVGGRFEKIEYYGVSWGLLILENKKITLLNDIDGLNIYERICHN